MRSIAWVLTLISSIVLSVLDPITVMSQPQAITPEDISRTRQLTTVSWDWSHSDAFDFKERVELHVTIERLVVPERGNAELLFTMTERQRNVAEIDLQPRRRYHATLQSSAEVERLALRAADLPEGFEAILVGWPASERNITPSVMLVDEMVLPHSQRTIKFHDHARMKRHREEENTRSMDGA